MADHDKPSERAEKVWALYGAYPGTNPEGDKPSEPTSEALPLAPEEVAGLLTEADHAEKWGANGGMVPLSPPFLRRVLALLDRGTVVDHMLAANERAQAMWREAHPADELVRPDRVELLTWLLAQVAALTAKADNLIVERDASRSELDEWRTIALDHKAQVAALTKERDEAKRIAAHWEYLACDPQTREHINRKALEALRAHGRHLASCSFWTFSDGTTMRPCNCGLDAALAQQSEQKDPTR